MKVRSGACMLALCISLLTGAVAARGAPDEAGAIRAVMAEQQAAWNRGDVDDFMHGYKARRIPRSSAAPCARAIAPSSPATARIT